jgi:uncharacterized protein (DUF2384 family)
METLTVNARADEHVTRPHGIIEDHNPIIVSINESVVARVAEDTLFCHR